MKKHKKAHIRYVRVICALLVLALLIGSGVFVVTRNNKIKSAPDNKDDKTSSYSYPDIVMSEPDKERSDKPKDLKDTIAAKLEDYPGEWSVYFKNLDSGDWFCINDSDFYPASMIKLFAMGACYQQIEEGKINENDFYSYINSMVVMSNNTAFNNMIWTIGRDYLTAWCKQNGYTRTEQNHGLRPSDNAAGLETSDKKNVTCAKDIGHMLEDIYYGKCVSKEASEKMMELLKQQYWRSKIPMGIPYGPIVANKTGDTEDQTHDGAIVCSDGGNYVLVIMCDYPNYASLQDSRFIELSQIVYKYFNNEG